MSSYTSYFTAADCQVLIANGTGVIYTDGIPLDAVILDECVSIGYRLNQSSTPIYTLSGMTPAYFSSGNTIGYGSLSISYVDPEYLKLCIKACLSPTEAPKPRVVPLSNSKLAGGAKGLSDAELKSISNNYKAKAGDFKSSDVRLNIGEVRIPLVLILKFNNETVLTNNETSYVVLEGVKFIGDSLEATSTVDRHLVQQYQFMFSTVKTFQARAD